MKQKFILIITLSILFSVVSCKTTSDTGNENSSKPDKQGQRGNDGKKGQRPTTSEIFSQMDANYDGKLAKSELKGPIKNDFSKIDTDNDGFITKEELESAQKPERRN